jgi:hypothetical protein
MHNFFMPGPHQHDVAPVLAPDPTPISGHCLQQPLIVARLTSWWPLCALICEKSYFLFIFLPLDPDPGSGLQIRIHKRPLILIQL